MKPIAHVLKLARARRLDARAWSRLQGLSIDSRAFQIRVRRACQLSRLCDELCRQPAGGAQ